MRQALDPLAQLPDGVAALDGDRLRQVALGDVPHRLEQPVDLLLQLLLVVARLLDLPFGLALERVQIAGHAVQRLAELADLVARRDVAASLQIALADALDVLDQPRHRAA